MEYQSAANRYETMKYNRTGKSGLDLPAVSLGLWNNFGGIHSFENARAWASRTLTWQTTMARRRDPPRKTSAGSWRRTCGPIVTNW